MKTITPGRVTALWLVLRTIEKMGGRVELEEALAFARRSSLRGGGLPINDGYNLGIEGGFFIQNAALIEASRLGMDALNLCKEDEPNKAARRLLLSTLTLKAPPAWVAYWQGDTSALELILPDADREMLQAAGLYPPTEKGDLLTSGWWRALTVVPLPKDTEAHRKAIGDAGEELSLAFERLRLMKEGYQHLAERVWWVARESPAYGFDIASFSGNLFGNADPESPLAIEVKSVAYPVQRVFPFYLSVHEWETASELGNAYIFHLWEGVKLPPNLGARTQEPRIATPDAVANHVAQQPRCGARCRWDTTRIEYPFEGTLQPI